MSDIRRKPDPSGGIGWCMSPGLTEYDQATAIMESRVAGIAAGRERELVWLVMHPPLYTAGTSTRPGDLMKPDRFPVHWTGRGGQLTYHGPGQRIAYLMLDVRRRFGGDVRLFVATLERWLIATLARLGVEAQTVAGRTGVWVPERTGLPMESTAAVAKIAAIGLRVRGGVSFHGLALNVAPDLSHYEGIVPCGITDAGVTSLERLGIAAAMKDVDNALLNAFEAIIAPVERCPPP